MERPALTPVVARRIQSLRSQRGWTAQKLADECARTGLTTLSRGTIAKIESGVRRWIKADELAVLAQALGVTPTELMADNCVTVLHLSDLRIGQQESGVDATEMMARLDSDVEQIWREQRTRPDLIVITGDLVATGGRREFDAAREFLERLTRHLVLGDGPGDARRVFRRLVIVPGGHDINYAACRAYFADCEADEMAPIPPYYPKWRHFAKLFKDLYAEVKGAQFEAEQPWSMFEVEDLKVVVAGLNSTIADSHRDEDHYGWIGKEQATWFGERMASYEERGWLRIGAVHHNPAHAATPASQERLRDADTLRETLGDRLNLLLHSHGGAPATRLGETTPGFLTLAAGSAETGHQYQVLKIVTDGLARRVRRYDPAAPGWLDGPHSREKIDVKWPRAQATFPETAAAAGNGGNQAATRWDRPNSGWRLGDGAGDPERPLDPRRMMLDRIADVCEARHPGAVVHRADGSLPYLRITYAEDTVTRQFRIGACVREFGESDVDAFLQRVRAAGPDLEAELVYEGFDPPPALRDYASRRGVRLRSFTQFQGLLNLGEYVRAQTKRLEQDRVYAPDAYVAQRYTDAVLPNSPMRDDLVGEMIRLLDTDDGRFLLLLGDFGRGKTFALHELARRIPRELPHVTPILIELRALDKSHTIDGLVAAHLANHHQDEIDLRAFRYMLQHGRIVLLFDGFDELVARVTYDRAAEHLQTLLAAAQDQAKIVVASRTQHFRTRDQVLTAMGERVGLLPQRRILNVADFTQGQIRDMLVNRYHGDAAAADRRLELLSGIADLLQLARNPRMLGFIADLDEARLLAVTGARGTISPAGLYQEILTSWLSYEEQRTQGIRGAPVGLGLDDLWVAVTRLALRMFELGEDLIGLDELSDVAEKLKGLAGDHLSPDQITHAMGAGSLLVRTDDGLFGFIHGSVMEWLLAREVAGRLGRQPGGRSLLDRRALPQLTIEFLCDLADTQVCQEWAAAVIADPEAGVAARKNASSIRARLSSSSELDMHGAVLRGEDLSHRTWKEANLTDAELSDARLVGTDLTRAKLRGARLAGALLDEAVLAGADLTGADLTGARLVRTDLTGADLTGADLSGARLALTDLTGVTTTGSRWRRSALINVTAPDGLVEEARRQGATSAPGQEVEVGIMPASVGVLFGFKEGQLPRPVAYDSEGAMLAIGTESGVVLVCDAQNGQPLRTLQGQAARTHAVLFSPREPLLATGSLDGTVWLWDTTTGRHRHVLPGHPGWVWPMLFDDDGLVMATGARDGVVRIWDTATGRLRQELPGHSEIVFTATFRRDGSVLATGDDAGVVRLWDPRTGELRRTLDADGAVVFWLRFHPSGKLLASGTEDGYIRMWDPDTGKLRHRLAGHDASIYALDFHPDGSQLVSGDTDGTVRVWDFSGGLDGEIPGRRLTKHSGAVYRIAYSPGGKIVASGDSDGAVRLWNTDTGELRLELSRHHASAWPMSFRPDGDQIATSSNDYTTKLWNTVTGECVTVLRGHYRRMRSVHFNSTGALLATSGNDGVVRIWDTRTGQCLRPLTRTPDRLISVVFGNHPAHLATASNDGRVYLWNAETGEEERQLDVVTDNVWALVYSNDGDIIATANDDHTVQLRHPSTGRQTNILRGHQARVRALAFSPDGNTLATGCDDHVVRLWNWRKERLVSELCKHSDRIFSLAYRPDGSAVASASNDGTACVWDGRTGELRNVIAPGRGNLWSVAYSPDGTLLAISGEDGAVELWDAENWAGRKPRPVQVLSGHTRRVWSVVFSPDGRTLASSSTDGTVRLWQLGEAGFTHRMTLLGLPEGWAAFAPDGRYKSEGEVAGHFWHLLGMCRFEPGELDSYLPEVRQVAIDAAL